MSVEKKKISRFEVLMDAGFGAQKAGDILIRAFAKTGKYVYIEPMIPAEISPPPRSRPAMSGVIIRLADFDITNIGNNTDLIIAQHEVVLNRRLDDEEENPHCQVLLDTADQADNSDTYAQVVQRVKNLGLNIILFDVDEPSKLLIRSLGGNGKNMYYIGMLAHIYNADVNVVIDEIKMTFGKKLAGDILDKNIKIFEFGYKYAKEHIPLNYQIDGGAKMAERILIDGNSSLSMGVIDAGIKLYAGYPITPASSIMHTLARVLPSYGGMVHQAEDEIGAIGTAIGSYFGGVPSITATSGPGLSLKQEFIGYAAAAEIPLIVIDVQRSGPSTGMPTKTEQSDLMSVIFGSHGDYTKIVLSVANVIDCFYAPQMARYLAEKLKLPVFIMSDFQTANSYKIIDKPKVTVMNNVEEIQDFVLERFHISRLPEKIEMVRTNQAIPGTMNGMRRVTGLNTDQSGSVNYFSKTNQRSHMIRNEKVHLVKRALSKPEMFGGDEGDILVSGWGSSRGIIEEAINNLRAEGIRASGIHFKIVWPLPMMLKDIFSRFKRIVTVEVAYGDELKPAPLATLLRAETLFDVHSVMAKATGRPLTPRGIMNKVKELLETQTVSVR